MKPRHFWWLVEDEVKEAKSKGVAELGRSDVRRLRRMMEKKQHELATTQG